MDLEELSIPPAYQSTAEEHNYRIPEQRVDLFDAYSMLRLDLEDNSKVFGLSDIQRYYDNIAKDLDNTDKNNPYRTVDVGIDNMPWIVKPFPDHPTIPSDMETFAKIFTEYMSFRPQKPEDYITVIEQAAQIKIDLTSLHPYVDGNGRLGRLLADGALMAGDLFQMPHWLEPKHKGKEFHQRLNYFMMIEQARQGYPAFLLKFMTEQQLLALRHELIVMNSLTEANTQALESGYMEERAAVITELEAYKADTEEYIRTNPPITFRKNPNFEQLMAAAGNKI